MKIHYIGLSSFLIENQNGYRILIDPFNNAPEWSLGPVFPEKFNDKPFGANIVLMSEPDADHAYAPGGWLENAPQTKPNINPFPNLNLKGSVVYEYNGDLNIAWQYTIDNLRLAHFADNSYLLTPDQINEIGPLDIIFISPPKVQSDNIEALNVVRKNIALLKPKIIIWAHHIAPKNLPKTEDQKTLRKFFTGYLRSNANTNKGYKDEKSFIELCYILENAILLNKEYSGITLDKTCLEIDDKLLNQGKNKPISILFKSMISLSKKDTHE